MSVQSPKRLTSFVLAFVWIVFFFTHLSGHSQSTNFCSPVSRDLVSWWSFEGNNSDRVGFHWGGYYESGFAPGFSGQALVLDEQAHYYPFVSGNPRLDVGKSDGFTVEGWINPQSSSTPQPLVEWNLFLYISIWGSGSGSVYPGVQLKMGFSGDGSLDADIGDIYNNRHEFNSPSGIIISNQWQHVALTYDKISGQATLYRNGGIVATTNMGTFTPMTWCNLYLGEELHHAWLMSDRPRYVGMMDEIAIYRRALESAEIEAIYLAGEAGKCADHLPPRIELDSNEQIVLPRDSVEFAATVYGGQPLHIQWSHNGTEIPGATNAVLLFPEVNGTNSGTFSLTVTNDLGIDVRSVVLNVITNGINDALGLRRIFYTTTNEPWFVQTDTTHDGIEAVESGGLGSWLLVHFDGPGVLRYWSKATFDGDIVRPAFSLWTSRTNSWDWQMEKIIIPEPNGVGYNPQWGFSIINSNLASASTSKIWLDDFVFTPGYPPQIHSSPYSQAVYIDSDISFTVVADGTGTLTYQWFFNNAPLIGETNSTLELLDVQVSQAGSYFVRISNLLDSVDTESFLLGVDVDPPVISQPPISQGVIHGESVSFSVEATGTPPFNYQWLFNGSPLWDQTNAVLTLTNVQFEQAGRYSVRVSNLANSVPSSVARLTVRPSHMDIAEGILSSTNTAAISFSSDGVEPWHIQSTEVHDGDTALESGIGNSTFDVAVTGPGVLKYWTKTTTWPTTGWGYYWYGRPFRYWVDGVETVVDPIPEWTEKKIRVPAGEHHIRFELNSPPMGYDNDELVYSPDEKVWIDDMVFVAGNWPEITTPSLQNISPREAVTIVATVTGDAPFQYQWFFDGIPLTGQTSSTLNITNVSYANGGKYTLRATNAVDFSESQVINLRVKLGLPILWGPMGLTLLGDDSPWYLSATHRNHYPALRSGLAGGSLTSSLGSVVQGPGVAFFWWKSQMKSAGAKMDFKIDDTVAVTLSGNHNWEQVAFFIPNGEHELWWQFRNPNSPQGHNESGWVADFGFIPGMYEYFHPYYFPGGLFEPDPNTRIHQEDPSISPLADLIHKPWWWLIWQNQDGRLAAWNMHGRERDWSGILYDGRPVSATLRLCATADIDSNGWPDLFWQHKNGKVALWSMMDDLGFTNTIFLRENQSVAPGWKLKAVGDMDGDSQNDLIWQHSAGSVAIWRMNQTNYLGATLLRKTAAKDWDIVATGDMNGDGSKDILWQHTDGRVAIWFMNKLQFKEARLLRQGKPVAPGWHIVGAKDLDEDNRGDIVWLHDDGSLAYWRMDGNQCLNAHRLIPDHVTGNWRAKGVK